MKTKEELQALKEEAVTLNNKLKELSEEELNEVTGGVMPIIFASVDQGLIDPKIDFNRGNTDWGSQQNLPTEPGAYKLNTDVVIEDNWTPDPHNTTIK